MNPITGKEEETIIIIKDRINDIRFLNKYFIELNKSLEIGDRLKGNFHYLDARRKGQLAEYMWPFNWLIILWDTFINRIVPKVPVVKKVYFAVTRGKGRVLSRAEVYGRLYSCGFELMEEECVGNQINFTFRKSGIPLITDKSTPSYGLLIRLNRIGKGGVLFGVYKLRTMHPYSEYLQQYIYDKYSLKKGGKLDKDFRISAEGKIMRKYWIDELPMLFNILKGEMKLVGVRPLSPHFFSLYSDELKILRIKTKPGLIPPFYADMPDTLLEIMESERKYLIAHSSSPYLTDLRYLFRGLYNIVLKGARSS